MAFLSVWQLCMPEFLSAQSTSLQGAYDQRFLGKQPKATNHCMSEEKEKNCFLLKRDQVVCIRVLLLITLDS